MRKVKIFKLLTQKNIIAKYIKIKSNVTDIRKNIKAINKMHEK